ncbi:head GIN domain-containing protein [Mangrovibacterium sp.]|uniref:head GIN domain-containing protein n=1 Tax=Mangrovibacterium sp. TaxID=1961364 RepID=UPI003563FC43
MKNQKTVIFLLVLPVFLLMGFSCHYPRNGEDEERAIVVADFDKLEVKGSFTIVLEQASEPGVTIRALPESIETVTVFNDSVSGRLEISRDKFSLNSPELHIRFRKLEQLHIEGGTSLQTEGYIEVDDLAVSVEGGGHIIFKLKANKLELRGEGGVVYELEGVCRNLNSSLYGASYLKGSDLIVDSAEVRIEGMGVASIQVNSYLQAKLKGMGKITYLGDPDVVQSIEGLGQIRRE